AHSRGISSGASRAVSVPLMFKLAMADVFLDWRGPRPTDVQDKKSAPAAAMPITTPFLPDPANVQAGGSALSARAALAHGLRQEYELRPGLRPAQAGVGDGHSVAQRHAGLQVLAAFFQMAFDHDADDARFALGQLPGDVVRHIDLALVRFVGVGVRAVDHDLFALAGRLQRG